VTATEPALRPEIDPRFAQRWVEVRREQGRRRLRILLAAASATAVLALLAGSVYTPLFKVRHLRVRVAGNLSSSEVLKLAHLSGYHLMIDVHTGAIAARLDSIPALGSARVSREWPGTVRVSVAVRTPEALVPTRSATNPQWAVVDQTGRVLRYVGVALAGLPILQGVGDPPAPGQWIAGAPGPSVAPGTPPQQEVDFAAASDSPTLPQGAAAALAAVQALPARIRIEVISVTVSASSGVTMTMLPPSATAGPVNIELGDGSQLSQKLTALIALVTKADLSTVSSIDLTVPDRPAALTAR
jgi:POTRA domain, FtsQ-type/Cell division protein FtsQ